MTSHPKDSIPGRYVAAIAAMALAAHGMMLGRGFVWDDRILRADWALRGHWGLFEPDVFGFVRPGKVFHFSFFETLFGGTAALWQLAALATVVVCGLLVLRLAMHFLPREGALAAALVYTVHPFHVESAGWPSAFNGTLMVLFALLFYLQLLRERFGWREVAVSCALVLSAVLMKE